jgi:hypothetical protein
MNIVIKMTNLPRQMTKYARIVRVLHIDTTVAHGRAVTLTRLHDVGLTGLLGSGIDPFTWYIIWKAAVEGIARTFRSGSLLRQTL